MGTDGSTSNQSPTVKVYPARTPGWNKVNLAAANEKHTQADVKAFLSDFFGDAQVVWVGKGGYSANAATAAKIKGARRQGRQLLGADRERERDDPRDR